MREYIAGTRVECNGYRGTVMFVGEVPPTKGTWLGVEWDDPSRGKHCGFHEGIQYFKTRNPNAGSFVRVNKIKPNLEFSQALSERYIKSSTDGYADEMLISELRNEMNAPFLELVGFEKVGKKQSNLSELRIVVLDHMCISHCDSSLKVICPSIEELDISSNLFVSWDEVANTTIQLPKLSALNVSDNKLAIPANPSTLQGAFSNLKELNMSHMDYTWKDVVQCSAMWPMVEILAVPHNKMTSLEFMNNDTFSYLRVLNLEGNSIEYWEEVNKLGQLPNLEQLSLYGCGLKNVQVKEKSFPKLQKLSLSNNNISQWQHISELDKLPQLFDLKLLGNKSLEVGNYETFTQWVIARIKNLQVLNGTEITTEDRRGAELDYLKHNGSDYLRALAQLKSSFDQHLWKEFQIKHPRYDSLVKKYGPPEQGEVETKPATLKNTLILLHLVCDENKISKKLPLTMEVQKLRTLCLRLFDLDSLNFTLFSYNPKQPDLYVPLDNNLRPLSFYSIEDSDVIVIKKS